MGANQSGGQKLRHQFAPELPPSSAGGQTSYKSSFGRHQLNKLFRKSLPAQSRCQIKCNSSESQQDYNNYPAARGGSNRVRRVLDNSNRSALDSNQYYVSPDERLVGANCPEPNNGRLHREPADIAGEVASRPLGQSHHQHPLQRQVRHHHHQQQPQQQPASAIEHHMHMKSGMMMTSSTANKIPQSQQPLNNSDARHLDHYAQHLTRQHLQQQQQQQQQQLQFRQAQNRDQQAPISVGIARPGKLNGKAQQKSSCSPSSASAASSPTSSSATSSAGGFSSSESLKLRQQQRRRRRQVNATNSIPSADHQLGERESRRELEWRQQQQQQRQDQLVAMQLNHSNQRHHRRSHSSGQPLSWSKQQTTSSMISNDANMLALAQRHNQTAAQVEQTSRGQTHRAPPPGHELGPHQLMSPDECREQSRLRSMASFNGTTRLDQGDDQFYSTNVHLLAVNPISPHEAYSNQSYPVAGSLSAPQQRRRRVWPPSEQQQFVETATLASPYGPLNSGYSQQYYVNMSQNQRALNHQQAAIYDDLELMQQMSQSANYYNQQEPAVSGRFHLVDYQAAAHLVDQSNTLKSRSKSLGKSSSVSKLRSRNPLASIFSPDTKTKQTSSTSHTLGANTIHHFKSHQNLPSSSLARSTGVNSLKRVKSSPLTTSSYEAMRAIDMYLIRQIARTCMDFEMEQKIDLEIRLRELATQSLLEAETELELLEVEKSLLTSDQRMNCYASQLEQKRKRLSNPSPSTTDSGRGSKTSHWDSARATAAVSRPKTTSCEAKPTVRTDVIGANGIGSDGLGQRGEFESPSGSSFSKGSHQMSPVSNESALSKQSPPLPTISTTRTNATISSSGSSSNELDGNAKQQHSWSSLSRSKHHVIRRPTSAADTLNRRRKSQRQQHLQQLAQMLAKLYNLNYTPSYETKSTVSLGELRVPLMWRDVDHFKGRGEYRRFAVFCVAKIGSQIYDTQLISDVDRQMTDLTFDDVILFNNVELDFQLELEVYSCVYLEQFSLSNTPRKLMEKFSNSVGRAMGRRLATRTASVNYIKELEAYDKSYRFAMIANTKLTLADASDSIKTYDLSLISPEAHGRHSTRHSYHQASNGGARNQQTASALTPNGNGTQQAMINREHQFTGNQNGLVTTSNQRDLLKNTLPLFGHICCRLDVRPEILDDAELGAPASSTTFGYL